MTYSTRQHEAAKRRLARRRREDRLWAVAAVVMVLFNLALVAGAAYVAAHFIAKWW